jgi:DNA-binding MarR family transcriptional regulator
MPLPPLPKMQSGRVETIRPETVELETAIRHMAYVMTRTRRHDRMKQLSGVPLDRAAMAVLLQLDESGPTRPGELAELLQVEAPHVTRQIQLLERAGYTQRLSDPDDGRAQLVRLTSTGRAAAQRIRDTSRTSLQTALAQWAPTDLHTLSGLLRRLIDDFMADATQGDSLHLPAKAG